VVNSTRGKDSVVLNPWTVEGYESKRICGDLVLRIIVDTVRGGGLRERVDYE
jgi:hypothetical protein